MYAPGMGDSNHVTQIDWHTYIQCHVKYITVLLKYSLDISNVAKVFQLSEISCKWQYGHAAKPKTLSWSTLSWAEGNLHEKREVGFHAYTQICSTAEKLQSNQTAGFKRFKWVLSKLAFTLTHCIRALFMA